MSSSTSPSASATSTLRSASGWAVGTSTRQASSLARTSCAVGAARRGTPEPTCARATAIASSRVMRALPARAPVAPRCCGRCGRFRRRRSRRGRRAPSTGTPETSCVKRTCVPSGLRCTRDRTSDAGSRSSAADRRASALRAARSGPSRGSTRPQRSSRRSWPFCARASPQVTMSPGVRRLPAAREARPPPAPARATRAARCVVPGHASTIAARLPPRVRSVRQAECGIRTRTRLIASDALLAV